MSKEFYVGEGRYETWPHLPETNLPPMGITFNDVLLEPGDPTTEYELIENMESRGEPDTSLAFGPFLLKIPVITAPMDTVSDVAMIEAVANKGGIGTLYRHNDLDAMLRKAQYLRRHDIPYVAAVGLKNALNDARALKERGGAQAILIDIANGGLAGVPQAGEAIQNELGLTVVAGNIARQRHAEAYRKRGIQWQRIGIGPGQVCITRLKTGIGVPQLSAVFDTAIDGVSVIADGGIKYPGDITKALAAGAKMVMIGSMFGGTDEAPGEVIELEDKIFKRLRGQASGSYMADHGVSINGHRTEEGVDVLLPYKGSVNAIIDDITGGLRSEMLYVGARNLQELYDKSRFMGITQSGYNEGTPTIYQQGNVFTYKKN
jgi:IMP dehydrogenase